MDEKVKQIKIDEDLFRMIYQYFIYGREDETELIKAGLKDKMDKMILRNIYTESKTAESVEERENARGFPLVNFCLMLMTCKWHLQVVEQTSRK